MTVPRPHRIAVFLGRGKGIWWSVRAGETAVATLVGRSSRFLIMLGLPQGKKAAGLADVLIDLVKDLPALMRGSLTWDQGTEIVYGTLKWPDMPS